MEESNHGRADSALMNDDVQFCKVRLQPGIRKKNMLTLLFAAFATFGAAVGVNTLQPYLLSNFLHIGEKESGGIVATVKTLNEVSNAVFVGLFGLASDAFGRRTVYAFGFVIASIGYALLPLSSDVVSLCILTIINGLGITAATSMMVMVPADYAVNADRGKATGYCSIMNGIGALFMAIMCGRIPEMVGNTDDGHLEGWCAYLFMAVFSAIVVPILLCGLAGKASQQQTSSNQASHGKRIMSGLKLACSERAVALACVIALVVRADGQITALYIPQWCVSFLIDKTKAEMGLDKLPDWKLSEVTKKGLARGSTCTSITGISTLLTSPIVGIVVDRCDRAWTMCAALVLSMVLYAALFFCSDPYQSPILVVTFMLGFAHVATVICSQVFIQKYAPAEARGTVLGIFSTFGALGQVVNVFVGGELFEYWKFQAPFAWMALMNLLAAIVCFFFCILPKRESSPLMSDDQVKH